jgi:hypothetical protein
MSTTAMATTPELDQAAAANGAAVVSVARSRPRRARKHARLMEWPVHGAWRRRALSTLARCVDIAVRVTWAFSRRVRGGTGRSAAAAQRHSAPYVQSLRIPAAIGGECSGPSRGSSAATHGSGDSKTCRPSTTTTPIDRAVVPSAALFAVDAVDSSRSPNTRQHGT